MFNTKEFALDVVRTKLADSDYQVEQPDRRNSILAATSPAGSKYVVVVRGRHRIAARPTMSREDEAFKIEIDRSLRSRVDEKVAIGLVRVKVPSGEVEVIIAEMHDILCANGYQAADARPHYQIGMTEDHIATYAGFHSIIPHT